METTKRRFMGSSSVLMPTGTNSRCVDVYFGLRADTPSLGLPCVVVRGEFWKSPVSCKVGVFGGQI